MAALHEFGSWDPGSQTYLPAAGHLGELNPTPRPLLSTPI